MRDPNCLVCRHSSERGCRDHAGDGEKTQVEKDRELLQEFDDHPNSWPSDFIDDLMKQTDRGLTLSHKQRTAAERMLRNLETE